MHNSLRITREYWPEVTDAPHFVVNLKYEGCNIVFDDIYFDKLDECIVQLEALYEERKGSVEIRGGFRFNAVIEAKSTGGIQFLISTESSSEFPGKLRLEGVFSIAGENAGLFIKSLIKLLRDGEEFII